MTPASPHDPQLKTLTLRDVAATYTDEGTEGPPLVMIHGLPGSVRDFRWLEAALRRQQPHIRVVRLDMPGFGGTDEVLGGRMTVEERSEFVVDMLKALELKGAILVGHSMGGGLILGAAVSAPRRVAGLAFLSSIGLRPHRGVRVLPNPRWMARVFCNPVGRRVLGGVLRRAFVKSGFPSSTPDHERFATVRALGVLNFETLAGFADEVAALGLPARVLIAEDDPLVEVSIAEELADALGAPLKRFEAGGHNIQKTHAVEVSDAVLAFTTSIRTA
ncbi:MAG: alpha/beta hydrolase [Proteobacteria bacterium]|nr:alpha/beta hydrolase [Pseudomonadota bacterium]